MYINMKRIANNDFGKILISIILGLGLSALFRKVCNDRTCIIVKGPPINEVENSIFSLESKCYKYKAKTAKCN